MSSHRRGPWSQGEDAYLTQLVHTQGPLNWVRIAQLIGSRTPKQCRERYHQNLKPSLNHEPISAEEGVIIERLVGEIGKRWAEIARRLHGRSDNAVKNWWNGSMNRRRRSVVRRRTSSRGQNDFSERAGPPLTFARHTTHHHQPLTINSHYSSGHRHIDPSLPSPAVSDISRADSADGPPSLISDSGSRHSTSPRGLPSPAIELPPLGAVPSNGRRQSVPMLQFGSNSFASESDAHGHAFPARFSQESKYQRPNLPPAPLPYRQQDNGSAYPSHSGPLDTRGHRPFALAPPTPVQLPPIQSLSNPVDRPIDRSNDKSSNRMNIASLLR